MIVPGSMCPQVPSMTVFRCDVTIRASLFGKDGYITLIVAHVGNDHSTLSNVDHIETTHTSFSLVWIVY